MLNESLQPAVDERQEVSFEQEIYAFLETLDKAVCQGDLDTIQSFYADDIRAFDMMPPLTFTSKRTYILEAWKKCFTDVFQFPIESRRHDMKVVVSGSMAYFHNLLYMNGKFKSGDEMSCWMRQTIALEKRDGDWLIVHEHNSVPVADDGSNRALMNLTPENLPH